MKLLTISPQAFEADNDVIEITKRMMFYFQYKVILIKDLYYTVAHLIYIKYHIVDRKVYFYQKNRLRHNKIGRTFKLSLFDNIFGLQNQRGDITVHSFNNFKHDIIWCIKKQNKQRH